MTQVASEISHWENMLPLQNSIFIIQFNDTERIRCISVIDHFTLRHLIGSYQISQAWTEH